MVDMFCFVFISDCSRLRRVNILVNLGHDFVFSSECFSANQQPQLYSARMLLNLSKVSPIILCQEFVKSF